MIGQASFFDETNEVKLLVIAWLAQRIKREGRNFDTGTIGGTVIEDGVARGHVTILGTKTIKFENRELKVYKFSMPEITDLAQKYLEE